MKTKLIYLRVLQQDTCDQVRMGASFPVFKENINQVKANTIAKYDKECAWCGGFQAGCERYYKRIALVDAETFQSVCEIYNRKGGK